MERKKAKTTHNESIKLRHKIFLLEKENRKLRLRLFWLTQKYNKLAKSSSYNDEQKTKSNSFEQVIAKTSQNLDVINIIQNDQTKLTILKDLFTNLFVSNNKRRYSKEFKLLSYTLYSSSSNTYNIIRFLFPFPSEQCLRKTFSEDVHILERQLTNINETGNILLRRQNQIDIPIIFSTLSVDSFAINNFKKVDNYVFIYNILPLSIKYRPFPAYFECSKSENANKSTYHKICQIFAYSKYTKFHISFLSVDGDPYYDKYFFIRLT